MSPVVRTFHALILEWCQQGNAHFHVSEGEQRSEPVIHWFFQILLAPEVALGRHNRGMPQKELDLLQFTSVYVAQLRTGPPKIVRRRKSITSGRFASMP